MRHLLDLLHKLKNRYSLPFIREIYIKYTQTKEIIKKKHFVSYAK